MASRIRRLSTVAPARGLDVEIYDDISDKFCPVSVLAHLLPRAPIYSRLFSGTLCSDLRPMGGVVYPAGVAVVNACAVGCALGSERRLKPPEEHMLPRLRRELPSITFLLGGERSQIRELHILQQHV